MTTHRSSSLKSAMSERGSAVLTALAILALSASSAQALTISTGDALTGNRASNLITNGSFESGNAGSNVGWTPGTHIGGYPATEVASIPGWTSTYPTGAYGWWGPLGFTGAAPANGNSMVYFGNSFNTAGASATVAANGVVTFNGTPTFAGRPGPVTLSQTVAGLEVGANYRLDFWTTGEDNTGGFLGTGVFGLDITGEARTYLALPTSANTFGTSQRYYVDFTANAASMTFTFSNWGHLTDLGASTSTELVLDDVILNRVSGPAAGVPDTGSSLLLLASATLTLAALRRRHAAR